MNLPTEGEVLERWYEGSAYGDHIPEELPKTLAALLGISRQDAWDLIMESQADDAYENLFRCIFTEGVRYTLRELEDRGIIPDNAPP